MSQTSWPADTGQKYKPDKERWEWRRCSAPKDRSSPRNAPQERSHPLSVPQERSRYHRDPQDRSRRRRDPNKWRIRPSAPEVWNPSNWRRFRASQFPREIFALLFPTLQLTQTFKYTGFANVKCISCKTYDILSTLPAEKLCSTFIVSLSTGRLLSWTRNEKYLNL